MYRLLAFGLLVPGFAHAADVETWAGGAISSGVYGFQDAGSMVDPLATQAEVDGMLGWGWGHVRVDFDMHVDPTAEGTELFLAYPSQYYAGDSLLPMPEWAMVQLGREKYHLRAGVFNPNMGLEDWDPWSNYAPRYSTNFVYAGAGRFAGGEASMTTEGGVDLAVFGGYDVDWYTAGGGVSVATTQDSFATWSGVFVYPQFTCADGSTCNYTGVVLSGEFYPFGPIWLDIDTLSGVRGGKLFTSEQIVVNILPEAVVNPFVRGEFVLGEDGVLDLAPDLPAPDATASIGARADLTDFLRIAVEGQTTLTNGEMDIGGGLMVALHTPEPLPYSYTDPFGEEAEE